MLLKKKKFSKDSFIGVCIILIFVSVVSAYAYFLSDVLNDQYGTIDDAPPADTIAQNSHTDPETESEDTNVWETLKASGLNGDYYELDIEGKSSEEFSKEECTRELSSFRGEDGNKIFVHENGDSSDNNQIIMATGGAKGSWAITSGVTFGVRDACTAPLDGDVAEMTLPTNEKGYIVAARILGKPTDSPEFTIDNNFMFIQDELDNDLLVLGVVTDSGFLTPTQVHTNSHMNTSGTDITGLFEWNGTMCYFSPEYHCYDETHAYTCTDTSLCCTDTNGDGVSESCTDPTIATDKSATCVTGTLANVACREYVNEWIFNIEDVVAYLWNVDEERNFKLAHVRFYPIH